MRMILILALSLVPITVLRAETGTDRAKLTIAEAYGPYCGLYSLYTALGLRGADVSFNALLKPEYCTGEHGSTWANLLEAGRGVGFEVVLLENMSTATLRASRHPVILHVKKHSADEEYDHYILFIRTIGDKARVFDAPSGMMTISFRELHNRWNGTGLVVVKDSVEASPVVSRFGLGSLAVVALLTAGVVGTFQARRSNGGMAGAADEWRAPTARAVTRQFAGVVGVSFILAMLFHLFSDQGLFAPSEAVAAIQDSKVATFLPTVERDEVRGLARSPSVLIVDARKQLDFKAGHIPGAMNVPVDSNPELLEEGFRGVPLSTRVVIYCQSEACPYSDIVARRLIAAGYGDISIYRGGWRDWEKADAKAEQQIVGSN